MCCEERQGPKWSNPKVVTVFLIAMFCCVYSRDLRLCRNTSELFAGDWKPNRMHLVSHDSLRRCPGLKDNLGYQDGYRCGHSYIAAEYYPHACNIMNISTSIKIIHEHFGRRINISFVGDSNVQQTIAALYCEAELYGLQDMLNITEYWDPMLRNGMPCHENCTDFEFRNQSLYAGTPYRFTCNACVEDGIRQEFDVNSPHFWANKMPHSFDILILGGGAWYNTFKFNGTKEEIENEYMLTIKVVARLARQFIELNKIVVWFGLPHPLLTHHHALKFGWDTFRQKNIVARSILEKEGVLVVDHGNVTLTRFLLDKRVSRDWMHWCNPGKYSVPVFLNEAIYHLIAVKFKYSL